MSRPITFNGVTLRVPGVYSSLLQVDARYIIAKLRDALGASRPTRDFEHNRLIAMAYLLDRLGVL